MNHGSENTSDGSDDTGDGVAGAGGEISQFNIGDYILATDASGGNHTTKPRWLSSVSLASRPSSWPNVGWMFSGVDIRW